MIVLYRDRSQMIALAALFFVLSACIVAPVVSLGARSQALSALADERDELWRLQLALRRRQARENGTDEIKPAPAKAFLNAPTLGLASAQLEAYVSRVALAQQASLISSGVQPVRQGDSHDVIRIQTTLTVNYSDLQPLLFSLETGTPYIFVDAMTLEPSDRAQDGQSPEMRITLGLRAIWRRSQM